MLERMYDTEVLFMPAIRSTVFVLACSMSMLFSQARAQHSIPVGTPTADRSQGISAPVPPLLQHGQKVFLSNAGAPAGLFPHPFTGTQDRGYGYLYNALQKDGHFQLVESPADAEMIFELQLMAPLGSLADAKVAGTADPLPQFKLTVYDRPTHYVLWTISQTIDPAYVQKTHDKNFDTALDLLLEQLKAAAGPGK